MRTGKDYMLFVLAICCGGTVTHSLVAPHPGPLAMAENLHLDLGQTIVVGIVAGIIPALAGWMVARWASRRLDAPMRETGGVSLEDLEQMVSRREEELPSLAWSLAPVLLPILLIGGASFLGVFGASEKIPALFPFLEFIGNRNVALVIGAALAVLLADASAQVLDGEGHGNHRPARSPPLASSSSSPAPAARSASCSKTPASAKRSKHSPPGAK